MQIKVRKGIKSSLCIIYQPIRGLDGAQLQPCRNYQNGTKWTRWYPSIWRECSCKENVSHLNVDERKRVHLFYSKCVNVRQQLMRLCPLTSPPRGENQRQPSLIASQ